MSLMYTNRRGVQYYIHETRTKTGKFKFFASKKQTSSAGQPALSLPPDFEIDESRETGQVSVRRRAAVNSAPGKNSRGICQEEVDRVLSLAEQHTDFFDLEAYVKKGAIVVCLDNEPAELRFKLVDPIKRTFVGERYCYKGSVDDWIELYGYEGSLASIAKKLLPHLGEDSFFELY